jgi:large repetitive protein
MKAKLLLTFFSIGLIINLASATPLTAIITGQTNVLCFGGVNGTATVTASGGTTPYTYAWSPAGGTNATGTGLSAGNYTVVVTDAASNTATATVAITQPTQMIITSSSSSDELCYGDVNGYLDVNIIGGTPPYTYLWNPSGGTNTIASALSAGTYTLTVTDDNGCTASFTATITQPPVLTATTTSSTPNTNCTTPSGTATETIGGGTAPYQYSWFPSGQTNATATGLNAGSYTCVVTDSHGCTASATATVGGIVSLSVTVTTTLANSGCNGTGTPTVTGGTPPYTYLWSPSGQTTAVATGLCPGYYCCTVTDVNGCSTTVCDSVTNSCSLTTTLSFFPNTCASSSDGSATITASAGTPPYTYLWAPGGQTTSSISGLSVGVYTVTVHDANGCSKTDPVTILYTAFTHSAYGSPTTISSGDSTYLYATSNANATYSWSPAASVTHPTSAASYAHPSTTTDYTVTITTGCGSYTDSVLITVNPACFTLWFNSTSSYCNSGTIKANEYGGRPPYTYLWSPGGQTTDSISGLSAGTYSVTVTDSTHCSQTDSVVITTGTVAYSYDASLRTIVRGDSTLLDGYCNAPPNTYSWMPAASITDPTAKLCYAHPTVTTDYTITITSPCGSFTDSILITVNCFQVNVYSTSSYCSSLGGGAKAFCSSGTPPYTYLWSPGGQTTDSISGLSAGTYTVTVHDSTGCSVTASTVVSTKTITYSATGTPTYINSGDSTHLTATCNIPATYSWAPSGSVTNPASDNTYAHPSATTLYTVTITTACGTYTDTVLINVNCFALAMSSTPAYYNCTSSYDGTATVIPSGGTPPYTYSWSPSGKTTATITGLYAGGYTVTVHDHTGCSSQGTVSVSSAAASLTVSALPSTISVGDSSYLSASYPVLGVYSWAPSTGLSCTTCSNPVATPTITTTYTVTVTDTCGVQTDTVTVYVGTCSNNFDEPICIVTIDTINGKPVIIWGRTNSPPDGSYVVYKENSMSTFVPIESQPLTSLSEYIDTSGNPSAGPISYKLATDDSCGESALSPVHTTIYLTTTAALNVYILNWTAYVGFTPSKYRIFRGPTLNSMVEIDSVPSTTLTYHDTLPPLGSIYLVQAVNPSSSCVPTTRIRGHNISLRALSGSMSNGFNTGVLTGINSQLTNGNSQLKIYPNPSNGMVNIEWSVVSGQLSEVRISIINELGQMVYENKITQVNGINKQQLNLENLSSGIYTLRLQTNTGSTVKKLVMMRNK